MLFIRKHVYFFNYLIFFSLDDNKQVPVLNHWWQSESGHPITANCIGLGHSHSPPKYSAGMPIPGYACEYNLKNLVKLKKGHASRGERAMSLIQYIRLFNYSTSTPIYHFL